MPEDHPDEPEQIQLMQRVVELATEQTRLSTERTKMSAERSELSAERSYMNAERTLSVWVRTALSLMIFGIAVDRFDLLLYEWADAAKHPGRYPHAISTWCGVALVAFGVIMAVVTGLRFMAYAAAYRRNGHRLPYHHGPFLAPVFALLTALFGILLLVLMLVFFG